MGSAVGANRGFRVIQLVAVEAHPLDIEGPTAGRAEGFFILVDGPAVLATDVSRGDGARCFLHRGGFHDGFRRLNRLGGGLGALSRFGDGLGLFFRGREARRFARGFDGFRSFLLSGSHIRLGSGFRGFFGTWDILLGGSRIHLGSGFRGNFRGFCLGFFRFRRRRGLFLLGATDKEDDEGDEDNKPTPAPTKEPTHARAVLVTEAEGAKAEHGVKVDGVILLRALKLDLIVGDTVLNVYVSDVK